MATPDYNACLENWWGWPDEFLGDQALFSGASNVVLGTNPPYYIQDFFALYPKFGGVPVVVTATFISGNSVAAISGLPDGTAIGAGNPVASPGSLPNGTAIVSIAGSNLTLSAKATASVTAKMTIWYAPPIPFAIIVAYVFLASACLVQARWLDMWNVAMGLYIAHFLSLYARSDGDPNSTTGQIASQGIATGIQVSKSVGDVSVSYQALQGLVGWGSWNLTLYGQTLATFAKAIGSGPMLVY
jgi:hypothetical protein